MNMALLQLTSLPRPQALCYQRCRYVKRLHEATACDLESVQWERQLPVVHTSHLPTRAHNVARGYFM